jgi:hypothetical protein
LRCSKFLFDDAIVDFECSPFQRRRMLLQIGIVFSSTGVLQSVIQTRREFHLGKMIDSFCGVCEPPSDFSLGFLVPNLTGYLGAANVTGQWSKKLSQIGKINMYIGSKEAEFQSGQRPGGVRYGSVARRSVTLSLVTPATRVGTHAHAFA